MPPRRRSADATFDDMVAGAFARNGLNTLLLDIKEEVGAVGSTVKHIQEEQKEARSSRASIHQKVDFLGRQVQGLKQTMDEIAPKVLVLDSERTQKIGARRFFRKHYVIGASGIGAAAAAWHQWDRLVTLLGRAFK